MAVLDHLLGGRVAAQQPALVDIDEVVAGLHKAVLYHVAAGARHGQTKGRRNKEERKKKKERRGRKQEEDKRRRKIGRTRTRRTRGTRRTRRTRIRRTRTRGK